MKIITNLARVLFVISLPLLLLSASIGWGFNSWWLYNYGFQKYDISQVTGIPPAELGKAAEGLIRYFNSNDEYANIQLTKDGKSFQLFNQDEQIHFKDVKGLVHLDYTFLIITSIYALGFALFWLFWRKRQYWRYLAWSLIGGSGLTLAVMLAMGLGILVDFQGLFLDFHQIAFTNQFWSAPGYMLMLFPEGFWSDAAGILAGLTVMAAIILGALSILYLKIWGRNDP